MCALLMTSSYSEGPCGEWFHYDCVKITTKTLAALNGNCWTCPACVSATAAVDPPKKKRKTSGDSSSISSSSSSSSSSSILSCSCACGKEFQNTKALRGHQAWCKESANSKVAFPCTSCDETFAKEVDLDKHVFRKHTEYCVCRKGHRGRMLQCGPCQ